MALHAMAHLPGVIVDWRLSTLPELPYHTTVLGGHLNLGDAGMRTMGALWLIAAFGFGVAAIAAGLGRPWWISLAAAAAGVSLTLSILAAPEARLGILVNLLIIAALVLGPRAGLL
ncbi:MAG TPA: hypothetical protein VHJ69_03730 [Gemmatimonadales bacterium]|nr:hypothetical protein [Gemmatimonadales bacterium]